MSAAFSISDGVKMRRFVCRPWRGSAYNNQKTRILIHGDSPYLDGTKENSLEAWINSSSESLEHETINLVGRAIAAYSSLDGRWRSSFWPAVVKIALGLDSEPQVNQYQLAFDRIAFNNYVHAPMASWNTAPADEQHRAARQVYLDELAELKPHLSLVLARRIWDALPPIGSKACCVQFGGVCREMWRYEQAGHRTLVGWVRHPATRFRINGWRDDLELGFAKEYFRIANEQL